MDNEDQSKASNAYAICRAGFVISLIIFAILFAINAALVMFPTELDDGDVNSAFLINQFNFDEEGNFATWASSTLILMAALGCFALSVIRSLPYPYVSRLLFVMGIGFLVLSMDDVAQVHGFVEEVIAGTASTDEDFTPAPAAAAFEDKLGPATTGILAILFIAVFLGPLTRMAQRGNIRYLVGCALCVAMASITELIYHRTACEEDWCFQLSSLFEESFEFGAILLFLAFLMYELFPTEIGASD